MRTKLSTIQRRKGSASLEMVLILPIILVGILLSQYISMTGMHRQDVVTVARSSAAHEAFNGLCMSRRAGFPETAAIDDSVFATCRTVDGEKGLQAELPFWDSMHRAGSAWSELPRFVEPEAVLDIVSIGQGRMRFVTPPFLESMSETRPSELHRLPKAELWTHYETSFQKGYDPIIYRELEKRGTHQLFPSVFPAAQ